jgi:hypothetical protein
MDAWRLKYIPRGSVGQGLQIRIILMGSRMRIRFEVKSWTRVRIKVKSWIRIRIEVMQIRNPGKNRDVYSCWSFCCKI